MALFQRTTTLLLILGTGSLFAGELFQKVTYDQALALAKKENKVVFIDFYTTWCGPCKMMDRNTFVDPNVIDWLGKEAVAIKVDAEADVALARKYKIRSYPSLVFANSDGTLINKITGYRDPVRFLKDSKLVLSGGDPRAERKTALLEKKDSDPSARMQYAQELAREEKFEEALKEFLHCYDHGNDQDPSFYGVRNSFLLGNIYRLSRKYPAAKKALETRRDALGEKLDTKQLTPGELKDYAALNRTLKQSEKTLALYDTLEPGDQNRTTLFHSVLPLLLEKKRYQDIGDNGSLHDLVDQEFDRYDQLTNMKLEVLDSKQVERMKKLHVKMAVKNTSKYYQVYLGLDEKEDAAALAERVLALDQGADTYNQLAWNAYLSGNPGETDLTLARKAHELSKGEVAYIVDTLAHVLASLDQKEEALALLKEAMPRFNKAKDKKMLEKCLKNVNET